MSGSGEGLHAKCMNVCMLSMVAVRSDRSRRWQCLSIT